MDSNSALSFYITGRQNAIPCVYVVTGFIKKKNSQEIKSARTDTNDSLGETMLSAPLTLRSYIFDVVSLNRLVPWPPSAFFFSSSKFTNGQICGSLRRILSGWAVWRLRTWLKWETVKPSEKYIDSHSPGDYIEIKMTHFFCLFHCQFSSFTSSQYVNNLLWLKHELNLEPSVWRVCIYESKSE